MKKNTLLTSLLCFLSFIFLSVSCPYNRGANHYCVSGDSFRQMSDFVYDELDKSLKTKLVKPGDIIFVKSDFLGEFFEKIHPRIYCKYILISHNSDCGAPDRFKAYLDDEKIVAWFAQNVQISHPKLHPIPVGIANKIWPHGKEELVEKYMNANLKREHFLYSNFAASTYPSERNIVSNLFNKASYCYFSSPKDFESYLKDMASSVFVLAPRGNGLDTHRVWEAIYLGSIAIVKTSSLDPLYKDLPVVIVNDWSEIDEGFLLEKYLEMQNKGFSLEKLDIKYWKDLIYSYKPLCKK